MHQFYTFKKALFKLKEKIEPINYTTTRRGLRRFAGVDNVTEQSELHGGCPFVLKFILPTREFFCDIGHTRLQYYKVP